MDQDQELEDQFHRELAEAGYPVESVAFITRTGFTYKGAIPIILKWIPLLPPRFIREDAARVLAVPWARPWISEILNAYEAVPLSGQKRDRYLRESLANALETLWDDKEFDRLAKLAQDKEHDDCRFFFVMGLRKSKRKEALPILLSLVDDPVFYPAALDALSSKRRPEARGAFESNLFQHTERGSHAAERGLRKIQFSQQKLKAEKNGAPNSRFKDFVSLQPKRLESWPTPIETVGLSTMFGEDGYCKTCSAPKHPQSGPLQMAKTGVRADVPWTPHWHTDTLCLPNDLAKQIQSNFNVQLCEIQWTRKIDAPPSWQLVIPTVGEKWFSESKLESVAQKLKCENAKTTCVDCGTTKWTPWATSNMIPTEATDELLNRDVAASPELFGGGLDCARNTIFRRELAELIEQASPKNFQIVELV